MITLALRRRGVGVDSRLHDAARTENRGWSKGQNMFGCTPLGFIGFSDDSTTRLKLFDVMFENRLRDRNQSGDVVVDFLERCPAPLRVDGLEDVGARFAHCVLDSLPLFVPLRQSPSRLRRA